MASDTSAGMPTSHGSQYFLHLRLAHHVPRVDEDGRAQPLAASKKGNSFSSERFQSLTWLPICTPDNP